MPFIHSKKAFRFTAAENTHDVPVSFVGPVPDWVAETLLYKLAVQGGDIIPADQAEKQTAAVDSGAAAPDDKSAGKDKGKA